MATKWTLTNTSLPPGFTSVVPDAKSGLMAKNSQSDKSTDDTASADPKQPLLPTQQQPVKRIVRTQKKI
jgi:hypothetical protein